MNVDPDTRQAAPAPDDEPQEPPSRRYRRWLPALVALLGLFAGGAWLFVSEAGLRASCRVLETLSAGQLSLGEPAGTLSRSFSLASLHWRSPTLDVELQALEIDWRPAELLRARLVIERLAAARLRVANVASSEPPQLPESLRLPLAIEVGRLVLGRLELGEYAEPQGNTITLAEALQARLASDGLVHRLPELQARVAGLAVIGEATLAAEKPFALTAKAGIEGDAGGRQLAFDLSCAGHLDAFELLGSLRPLSAKPGENLEGELSARIEPFAQQVLREAVLKFSGIDPAAWSAGAPQALFDLRAELQPLQAAGESASEGLQLGGRLLLANRRPGAIDRQLLPLESLAATLQLGTDELHLDDLEAHLSGGARLSGSATLRQAELALRLAVRGLDASAIDSRLSKTQLAGPLRATVGLNRQQLEIDFSEPRFACFAQLAIDPAEVAVEALKLSAGDARLIASGKVGLVDSGKFALQGKLQNFDPSRFGKLPAARLNAEFDAQGSREPQLTLGLKFQLRDSRLGRQTGKQASGQALSGHGEIDFAGQRLRKADVELAAAGNRLSAQGAFGAAGDKLTILIAAPKLDALAVVGGDLAGSVIVGGTLKAPQLSADLHSTRLVAPGVATLNGLEFAAQLADGSQGALSAKLRLAALEAGPSVVREIALDAAGLRSRHHLTAQLILPGQRDLHLALDGGLKESATSLSWAGTLSEFVVGSTAGSSAGPAAPKSQPFLRLSAPMPLQVAAGSFSAGPAELLGAGWSLRHQRTVYDALHWQSAGSLHGLPVAVVLAEFPAALTALGEAGQIEALRVNGEWDLQSGGPPGQALLPNGRARLWRESGDFSIGSLPLGLQEASFGLAASGGHVEAQLKLRGKTLGEIEGQLSAASSAATLIDRRSPWRGQLTLNTPNLAWAGPLLGENWQLGGHLTGALRVDGTPGEPRVNGEWRGDDLQLRVLDQGVRLARGKLLVDISGDSAGDLRLNLKQLVFESDFQPMPRTLQLDAAVEAANPTARPGRIEASGELHAGEAGGFLTLKADRVGILQRPDQWVLVSGNAQIKLGERALDIVGSFKADAGYWELAKSTTPQLSDDVVIKQASAKAAAPARLVSVNLDADLGRSFYFRGAGVESRLVGAVKIRSEGAGLPRATGTIRTRDGRFDAYGQKLDIERGILNFQGLIDNPGLNIRAVRRNLPVEAGVEVTGTARRPVVKLVSDPDVPDAEKLSWLVLGQAPDQHGGQDASVLMAAAQTILGGSDGGPLKAVQQSLGIDEFGVTTGNLDGSGRWQSSRIASTTGFGSTDTTTGQIVNVGKRLASNILLSYEQSLSTNGSIVKLTVNLGRNFSVVGRAGTDNALDLLWNYRFGR